MVLILSLHIFSFHISSVLRSGLCWVEDLYKQVQFDVKCPLGQLPAKRGCRFQHRSTSDWLPPCLSGRHFKQCSRRLQIKASVSFLPLSPRALENNYKTFASAFFFFFKAAPPSPETAIGKYKWSSIPHPPPVWLMDQVAVYNGDTFQKSKDSGPPPGGLRMPVPFLMKSL